MRVFLTVVLVFTLCFSAQAANFYVDTTSSGGNGTTTATSGTNAAFATLAQVNSAVQQFGDTVYFKRGQTWRGQLVPDSGTEGGYVTYSAYGTGVDPIIYGSKSANTVGDWTDLGGNIWRNSNTAFSTEVGNVIYNQGATVGVKRISSAALTTQGDFWWDDPNNQLRVYSVSNPATYYSGDIECALRQNVITVQRKQYIIVENLNVKYGAASGIDGSAPHHIIVRDCEFSYLGGGLNYAGGPRYGNGIQFGLFTTVYQGWDSIHDITIERNLVYEIWDAGISVQSDQVCSWYNIYIRNNVVYNCHYSLEFFAYNNGARTIDNFYIENNTCAYAGSQWGYLQRSGTPVSSNLMMWGFAAPLTNFYIRNNVFYESKEVGVWWWVASIANSVSFDYNCYYESSGNFACRGPIENPTYYTVWANYLAAIGGGKESHGINSDPTLDANYALIVGSPCIDVGVTTATVPTDYLGVTRPVGVAYDIGAYEYQATGADTTAPSAITGMTAATGTNIGEVALSFTAPGDDAGTGTVTGYTVKYNSVEITAGNYDASTTASTSYSVVSAGATQAITVSGLTQGATYYFAVKAYDEVPNTSAISNSPSAVAKAGEISPDLIYYSSSSSNSATASATVSCNLTIPAAATNANRRVLIGTFIEEETPSWCTLTSLTVNGVAATKVTSTIATTTASMSVELWEMNHATLPAAAGTYTVTATATGTCNDFGIIALCYYNAGQGALSNKETATEVAGATSISDSITTAANNSLIIQLAGDGNLSTPTASNSQTKRVERDALSSTGIMGELLVPTAGATTVGWASMTTTRKAMITIELPASAAAADSTAPGTTSTLAAATGAGGSGRIDLTWTAPGDDNTTGTATSYDIRYSTATINAGNWAAATPATGEPTPSVAGTTEVMTITGLTPSTPYYFALITSDEVPNLSALSNVPNANSSATPPVGGSGTSTYPGSIWTGGCSSK
jgi:hypothetical protein